MAKITDSLTRVDVTLERKEHTENDELKRRQELAKSYIRVGDNYLKEVLKPNKNGELIRAFLGRNKDTVNDDIGKELRLSVKKYEGYCNVPSHINYQKEIGGFFNEYFELSHRPHPGSFDTIAGLLHHLFGVNHYEFILDYLQLLYLKPTQRLPILLLESEERNTGKSTFGNLLKLMFQDNAIKVGNTEFNSAFNALWATRLLIIVDETSLEKKELMEQIKKNSTETGQIPVNDKGVKLRLVDFYGKYVFMSNEEGKALPIQKGEIRFAVFKIKPLVESGLIDNPNIESNILSEIPAFLNYLLNRKLHHKEDGRMYFPFKVYKTDQLERYYENSLSVVAKAIKELVKDTFEAFPREKLLKFSTRNIIREIEESKRLKYANPGEIQKAITEELKIPFQDRSSFQYFSFRDFEHGDKKAPETEFRRTENNKYFIFHREDYF